MDRRTHKYNPEDPNKGHDHTFFIQLSRGRLRRLKTSGCRCVRDQHRNRGRSRQLAGDTSQDDFDAPRPRLPIATRSNRPSVANESSAEVGPSNEDDGFYL